MWPPAMKVWHVDHAISRNVTVTFFDHHGADRAHVDDGRANRVGWREMEIDWNIVGCAAIDHGDRSLERKRSQVVPVIFNKARRFWMKVTTCQGV